MQQLSLIVPRKANGNPRFSISKSSVEKKTTVERKRARVNNDHSHVGHLVSRLPLTSVSDVEDGIEFYLREFDLLTEKTEKGFVSSPLVVEHALIEHEENERESSFSCQSDQQNRSLEKDNALCGSVERISLQGSKQEVIALDESSESIVQKQVAPIVEDIVVVFTQCFYEQGQIEKQFGDFVTLETFFIYRAGLSKVYCVSFEHREAGIDTIRRSRTRGGLAIPKVNVWAYIRQSANVREFFRRVENFYSVLEHAHSKLEAVYAYNKGNFTLPYKCGGRFDFVRSEWEVNLHYTRAMLALGALDEGSEYFPWHAKWVALEFMDTGKLVVEGQEYQDVSSGLETPVKKCGWVDILRRYERPNQYGKYGHSIRFSTRNSNTIVSRLYKDLVKNDTLKVKKCGFYAFEKIVSSSTTKKRKSVNKATNEDDEDDEEEYMP